MSQVQLSVSFTVSSAPTPLTVTPSSVTENLTVGTPVDSTVAVAVVAGGVAPYSYALDASSQPLPDGVSFSEDASGNIFLEGTPTTTGTANVVLNVTDSDGATVTARTRIGAR